VRQSGLLSGLVLPTPLGKVFCRGRHVCVTVLAARFRHGQEEGLIPETRVKLTVDLQLLGGLSQRRRARVLAVVDVTAPEPNARRVNGFSVATAVIRPCDSDARSARRVERPFRLS
jgi:hypothetical protein